MTLPLVRAPHPGRRLAVASLAAYLLAGPRGGKWARAAPPGPPTGALADPGAMRALPGRVPAPADAAWSEFGAGGAPPVRRVFADYRGRALLLNLWATWCGPCVGEMPSLAAFAPHARAAGIVVLPVSIDRNGAEAVRPFFARSRIEGLPVLADADGSTRRAFSIGAVPVTFLVAADGTVRGRLDAGADWSRPDALARLRALLA